MSKVVVFAFVLVLPVVAFARIGETPAQCEARYGKAIKTDKDTGLVGFRKGGFVIMVGFHQGKANSIVYQKEDTNILDQAEEMSDNEIQTLLKSNGGDKKWKKREIISMNREWQTEDGALFAHYATFDNMLFVATKEYLEKEEAKKKAKENKKLEGF